MPSALETLIKILKQERDTGCENRTVIGGLGAYSDSWQRQAREQARRAEHMVLADELVTLMRAYDQNEKKDRVGRINYMLDRITGRLPVPPQYRERLETLRVEFAQPRPTEPPPQESRQRPERTQPDHTSSSERPPRPERRPAKSDAATEDTAPERPPRPERTNRKGEVRTDAATSPRPVRGERLERLDRAHGPLNRDAVHQDKPARSERPVRSERPARPERTPGREDRRPNSRQDTQPRLTDNPREVYEFEYKFIEPQGSDLMAMPRLARPPRTARPALTPAEAEARLAQLHQPVTVIKGIGPKVAETLQGMGISDVESLIYYLPRRYDDYTRLRTIYQLEPESVSTVIGKVTNANVRAGSNGRRDFFCTLEDGTGKLNVTFFGAHFLRSSIRDGMQVVVSGKVMIFRNIFQMTNPEWEALDNENLHTIGIVPVYRLSEGVKARSFRRTMKQAVETWADTVPDYVPLATLERAELADLGWAIRNLHFPQGWDHLDHARRRRVFDELLLLQLTILGNRREWQSVPGIPLTMQPGFLDTFLADAFPYDMTGAQNRAINDIVQDVAAAIPMNRLIQGDVGSGKTAVAITAMAMAVHNGTQAALMAPTSILAEQHYRAVSRAFDGYPADQKPVVGLLTGALSAGEREAIYRGLADGSIDVIVGTTALIQEGVEFKALAVAVVDEQHRFGVEQRARLRSKGTHPHLLVMTATPIPRTLALTLYADLDLTIIDEKPQGRKPIRTTIQLPEERERIYDFVEAQLIAGRQAFVIHPLVEASDTQTEMRSAVDAFEELKQVFSHFRVCLLHGRMTPREKDDIMAAFSRHEYDVMVTTSVAEVGVDIPNASVIIIESANRFGLAQLHQFRGRVGRGEHESYCMLMTEPGVFDGFNLADGGSLRQGEFTPAQQRLLKMRETDDGFALAELDWRLRGAGDLLGARQSGTSSLQLTELMMPDLVTLSQREARTIYQTDPSLSLPEHHLLRQLVAGMRQDENDVS